MSAQTKNKEMGKALQFIQEIKGRWIEIDCKALLPVFRELENEMRDREEKDLCGLCGCKKCSDTGLDMVGCGNCRHKKFIYDLLEEENKDNKEINIK